MAQDLLRAIHALPRCEFWPDVPSYLNIDLRHVCGHRQVTDAYLVALAAGRTDAFLATLDEGLAQSRPDRTVLIPALGCSISGTARRRCLGHSPDHARGGLLREMLT